MLEIEVAKKDLKKAQKKQAKAQARLEAQSAHVQTLEHQQEPFELESGIGSSVEQQLTSPDQQYQSEITLLTDQIIASPHVEEDGGTPSSSSETGTSTSNDAEPTPSIVEETTALEVMVVTNEVTEGTEAAAVQDDEIAIATEPAPTPTTPRKAPAQKTAATRKSAVTKQPTRPSTATKRSASRSSSTRKSPSDAE
jgi:hypothetical protein